MSDLQLLFFVLALLYLWECACWINCGTITFRAWFGSRWRAVFPSSLLGNQRGGFVFAHPLPPLGSLLAANHFPLALAPEGFLSASVRSERPGQSPPGPTWFPWSDIEKMQVRGKKITIKGSALLVKMSSAPAAEHVGRILRQFPLITPTERGQLIEKTLHSAFETSCIEQEWQKFQRQTHGLRLATNILFIYLVGLVPTLIRYVGFGRCWLFLLAGLLALTTTIAILFHRVHKRFYPEAEDDRFTHSLVLLLSPVTAIRARDVLSRPLFHAYDPLAVAKVFCSTPQFEHLAKSYWRELRYAVLPTSVQHDRPKLEIEHYWHSSVTRAVENFLQLSGVKVESLIHPPARADETCLSFCPRCLAQFTMFPGVCADCGGLALVRF